MDLTKLLEKYWFHDGTIQSFHLDIQKNSAELELLVKRSTKGKLSDPVEEKDLVDCTLKLTFEDLIEASVFDIFPTQGYYINFSSYTHGDEEVGISFNVHDSASYVHKKDNWVIKAKRMLWKDTRL
jgi:hypothetical protein